MLSFMVPMLRLVQPLQTSAVSSTMFLTANHPNPLTAQLVTELAGRKISWGLWALAAAVPGLVSLFLIPLLLWTLQVVQCICTCLLFKSLTLFTATTEAAAANKALIELPMQILQDCLNVKAALVTSYRIYSVYHEPAVLPFACC